MNALVIGLGSMGRRRIRLMKQLGIDSITGVDANSERCGAAEAEYGMRCFQKISDAMDACAPDMAFVCTSPVTHAAIIRECLEGKLHVFTELNLVSDGYEENMRLARQMDRRLFMSSTMLYRDEIVDLCRRVHDFGGKMSYTYHVGQYLPDWHPWENYKDFFVSNQRTDGCREIMAIELPWLLNAFGPVKQVDVVKKRQTDLEISFPDTYLMTVQHERGHVGQLLFDIVARVPVRHFEAFGQSLQIEWRGEPAKYWVADAEPMELRLMELSGPVDRQEGYRSFIIENAYKNEIQTFLDMIRGNAEPRYTFADDFKTLRLIDEIQGAAC